MVKRNFFWRAVLAASCSNSGPVVYGACGESPPRNFSRGRLFNFSTAVRTISRAPRLLLKLIISRNEITRKGVLSETSGNNSGTASMSATVVTPERNSIFAPCSHDCAKSE